MATATGGDSVGGVQIDGAQIGGAGTISPGSGDTGGGATPDGDGATTAQSVLAAAGDSGASGQPALAARVTAIEAKLGELEALLQQATQAMAAAEQARQLEKQLQGAGAVDVPTAAAVIAQKLGGGAIADIAAEVAALKQSKPFLFRSGLPGSAMGPATKRDPLTQLAEQAVATGDKRALLEYLRARRGG